MNHGAVGESSFEQRGAAVVMAMLVVAIAAMMAWLRRATFTPFVVYRVVLGVLLLAFAYGFIG